MTSLALVVCYLSFYVKWNEISSVVSSATTIMCPPRFESKTPSTLFSISIIEIGDWPIFLKRLPILKRFVRGHGGGGARVSACVSPTPTITVTSSWSLKFFLKNGPYLASFSLFLSFQNSVYSKQMFNININFCQWLDLYRGHLVSEATALPTEPQPLPKKFKVQNCLKRTKIYQKMPGMAHSHLLWVLTGIMALGMISSFISKNQF